MTEIPDILRPKGLHRLYRRPLVRRLLARHFHRAYYYAAEDTVLGSTWLGVPTVKLPLDLWIYQELIAELRPRLVVETGTYNGGSALYLGGILDALGHGRLVSIDIQHPFTLPEHPRVEFFLGSSTAPETLAHVQALADATEGGPVLVILDSDHSRDHVLAELHAYAPLVASGSYLVVEDTNANGHPVLPDWGPGPMEAVDDFLATPAGAAFTVDPRRERFMLTMNPRGFLRRR